MCFDRAHHLHAIGNNTTARICNHATKEEKRETLASLVSFIKFRDGVQSSRDIATFACTVAFDSALSYTKGEVWALLPKQKPCHIIGSMTVAFDESLEGRNKTPDPTCESTRNHHILDGYLQTHQARI